MQTVPCTACDLEFPVQGFLSACSGYWATLNLVRFTCPSCSADTDVQLTNDQISQGYVYAAGVPHFAGVVDTAVPGLIVQRHEDGLRIRYGDFSRGIGPR